MTRSRLFSISPEAPFLPTLADRVLDGTLLGGWGTFDPFWLADVTIILPTRRSRMALAAAFADRLGGSALLPDIRVFGGEAEDEEPFLPPVDAPLLPPAVSRLERRLILARLIDAWARTADGEAGFASPPNAAESFSLADSLAQLLDDLAIQEVSPTALRAIAPEALAANWQQTLRFLDIVLTAWPEIAAGRGRMDAAPLRNLRLAREAETAPLVYGERPVIAAGSTGSILGTARLLRAVAALPRGAVVLPGLDTGIAPEEHRAMLETSDAPHGHAQYGLLRLLRVLEATPAIVVELAPVAPQGRAAIMRSALALAETTAGWAATRRAFGEAEIGAATAQMSTIAAPNEDLEARAIALAARNALARRETVGIVSPDRNLARRIAAELGRFGVRVDDAAGAPLFHSGAGRVARLLLAVAENDYAPVDLMALLRNRSARLGLPRREVSRLADRIELALLRGYRPRPGIAGLRRALQENVDGALRHVARLRPDDGDAIARLFDALEAALEPVTGLLTGGKGLDATRLAAALGEAFARVMRPAPGEPEDGLPGTREFTAWVAEIVESGAEGPSFPPGPLSGVLAALMAGYQVRNVEPRRTDIEIWGRLEARLQSPDLMIVAALNEDVWPEPADPGPWLSRGMRLAAGLEPPERMQGLAAHDFEMAAGNGRVILAFSQRLGTSPALPSRLLQRFEAFLGEDAAKALRARGAQWIEAARTLDAAGQPRPAARPEPRPPASQRPRRLSVTEIEPLMRSPYDIYARHVLALRALPPLGEEVGARERGSLIHGIFARFVEEAHDPLDPEARGRLEAMADEAFAGLDAIAERRDIWLRRFSRAAELFLAFERARQGVVATRHAEIAGRWEFPALAGFALTGRADRLDSMRDGTLEIIDFKTGSLPQPKQMRSFEAPQLLLEAAMAASGAFGELGAAQVGALTYIKIGFGPDAFRPKEFVLPDGVSLAEAADEAAARLQRHVAEFLVSDRLPMTARIRPVVGARYRGEFDHLARTDEWTAVEEEDSPP